MQTADVGFISVHFEEEFPFYELRDAFADPFGKPWTFAEDDAVIGITHKRKPAPFKFSVKFRQHCIAQYGTERTALRNSIIAILIFVPDYSTEALVYQRYDYAVIDCLPEQLHQLAVVDCVKELFKVKGYAVFTAVVNDCLQSLQSLVGAPSRAEAVA